MRHETRHVELSRTEAVSQALAHTKERGKEATHRVQQLVREHPLASVGVTLGSGLLLGVVAHKLLAHKVTLGEALLERAGVNRVRDRVRSWV